MEIPHRLTTRYGQRMSRVGAILTRVPFLLLGLPFALAPLLGLGETGGLIVWCAIMAHAVGADWLLMAKPPDTLRGLPLVARQLLIGAPTALFTVITTTLIVREGDVALMALPICVLPALLVWPFVFIAIVRGPPNTEEAQKRADS